MLYCCANEPDCTSGRGGVKTTTSIDAYLSQIRVVNVMITNPKPSVLQVDAGR
jgi:hypothetical protein